MDRRAKPPKGKAEAKRSGAGESAKDRSAKVRDLEQRLTEALAQLETSNRERGEAQEQQAATAEVLRVISSSPSDIQFVFDTIVRTAARLCDGFDANLVLADGDEFVQRAHHGPIGAPVQDARFPLRGTVSGRAISEARIIQVDDLAAATEYPVGSALAQRIGYRTTLIVPLVRDGLALGAIGIRRTEVEPFTDRQVKLLQTFADQAVIAIENVRLFQELEARNRDVTETLEQQMATAEILRVISQSPTDVQPVFDTIAEHAWRLCDATVSGVLRFDGELVHVVALSNVPADSPIARAFPMPPSNRSAPARAVLTAQTVHIPDVLEDPEYFVGTRAAVSGFRSALAVPMLRGGNAIGSIVVGRSRPGPYSERQIGLLKTFADQAVIAIENVRLFTELDARNRQLTSALEQQTATSEILRVISGSQMDVQPVFESIATNASRLCEAFWGAVFRFDGELIHLAAHHNAEGDELAALVSCL